MLQTVRVWKRLKALSKTGITRGKRLKGGLIAILLFCALGMAACGNNGPSTDAAPRIIKRMSEVSPPVVVQSLAKMSNAQPQVSIVSPRPNAVIDNDDVSIRFRVRGLDLYKDEAFGLGPHLNILVDNEFYGTVYDTADEVKLTGLTPGSHSVRAIAATAWDESFKNADAYAQTTFHVFTKTPLAVPPDGLPLLTYSRPATTYGAEPILLDYFFTPGKDGSASSPSTSDEQEESIVQGWQVRATINGEPFIFDQWEPIYLKGFKSGKNWVQLELLDDNQQPIEGLFNNTARIIKYEPGGDDTLSLLMRDELSLEEVGTLVDASYEPPVPETNEPESDLVESIDLDDGDAAALEEDEAMGDLAGESNEDLDEESVLEDDSAAVEMPFIEPALVEEDGIDTEYRQDQAIDETVLPDETVLEENAVDLEENVPDAIATPDEQEDAQATSPSIFDSPDGDGDLSSSTGDATTVPDGVDDSDEPVQGGEMIDESILDLVPGADAGDGDLESPNNENGVSFISAS